MGVINGALNFLQTVDVRGFDPSEISVKITNRKIEVNASSVKEEDGARFIRRLWKNFPIPDCVQEDNIYSFLDNRGILKITSNNAENQNNENIDSVVERFQMESQINPKPSEQVELIDK